jgi:predicted transcriptional regulator
MANGAFSRMAKSTKARSTRDAVIGFRVTSDLKEQLEQLAEADNRPLSNYLEHVLKAYAEAEAAKQQGANQGNAENTQALEIAGGLTYGHYSWPLMR